MNIADSKAIAWWSLKQIIRASSVYLNAQWPIAKVTFIELGISRNSCWQRREKQPFFFSSVPKPKKVVKVEFMEQSRSQRCVSLKEE